VVTLITYRPFYKTLDSKGITEYQLIFKHGYAANILHRMKHGKPISTKTLDTICFILDCPVSSVLEYVKDE
jgi:DNA-binding Xre family transcriptional regulator